MPSKPSILVVDDSVENLHVLSSILKTQDFVVRAANTGALALETVQFSKPDLILLDIKMPDLNGFELCEQLKSDPDTQSIPVIFISGMDRSADKLKAFQSGACDYIVKPFHAEEVIARVASHLALKHCEDRLAAMRGTGRAQTPGLDDALANAQSDLLFAYGEICAQRTVGKGLRGKRIASFSSLFATLLAFDDDEARLMRVAAPLYDVGKIGIPDAILTKQGPLSDQERQVLETYPTIGFDMLKSSDSRAVKMAATVAHEHRERWDGEGFPQGLQGDQISTVGQVAAGAIALETLLYERADSDEPNFAAAEAYFDEQRGRHFCPPLVDALLDNVSAFKEVAATAAHDK